MSVIIASVEKDGVRYEIVTPEVAPTSLDQVSFLEQGVRVRVTPVQQ